MSDNVSRSPARGHTVHEGRTIDTSDYGSSVGFEGRVARFADVIASTSGGVNTRRSDNEVKCRLVRNVSGIALLPKRAVKYKSGFRYKRVDGYCNATAEECAGIVDEHLPAAGVRNGDLFWIVVGGPTLVLTSLAGDAENVITEGNVLYALTAATSQATTAGRVIAWNGTFSAAQTTDGTGGKITMNHIGRAMSAKTTANTNADLLVDLKYLS